MTRLGFTPTELPEVRAALSRLWGTEAGRQAWTFIQGVIPSVPAPTSCLRPNESHADTLLRLERERLATGELYAVTEELTALIRSAASALPGYRLHPEDVPATAGVCAFADPLADSDEGHPVVLVLWSTCDSGAYVSWYTRASDAVHAATERAVLSQGGDMTTVGALLPYRLTYDSDTFLPYGEAPAFGMRTPSGVDMTGLVQAILTTWLLIGEPYTAVEHVRADRPTRRRLAAAGEPEPPPVRLLTLRRRQGDTTGAGGDDSSHTFHHRWLVAGHWRNQWYPSRRDYRPRYIAPYLKGPDGAPLLLGDRVKVLRR